MVRIFYKSQYYKRYFRHKKWSLKSGNPFTDFLRYTDNFKRCISV
ncbi:Hypothetical protein EUBREC_0590 [Agathobacter rectalis ATCC 33656]|uniref:Uncharacterized protein n=1 Tax=Agathobacter rectalis (strain ATCC 33656 / DSM 3377 / JCM 17463 / KCTC 5835 / VPI 0990) TaxID=515619 RepID=C4ZCM5_AGARV|nr:Hypothetical protein EUBREC_0590 [Agathobacter rectalis ATCC 33656]